MPDRELVRLAQAIRSTTERRVLAGRTDVTAGLVLDVDESARVAQIKLDGQNNASNVTWKGGVAPAVGDTVHVLIKAGHMEVIAAIQGQTAAEPVVVITSTTPPAPNASFAVLYQGMPKAYDTSPVGFATLATVPAATTWEVGSVWVHNSSSYACQFGLGVWPAAGGGSVNGLTFRIHTLTEVDPLATLSLDCPLALGPGDRLIGVQQRSDTLAGFQGLTFSAFGVARNPLDPHESPGVLYQGKPKSYITSPTGFDYLSPAVPAGVGWDIRSVWVHNYDDTNDFRLGLGIMQAGGPALGLTVNSPEIRLHTGTLVGRYGTLLWDDPLAMGPGDRLVGMQYQANGTTGTQGLVVSLYGVARS